MEDKRAFSSGLFGVRVLASPIALTATACVALLLGVIVWNVRSNAMVASNAAPVAQTIAVGRENPVASNVASNATEFDAAASNDLSNFAPQVVGTLAARYATLQQSGTYTPEKGAAAAAELVPSLKAPISYKRFSISDITIVQDASYARMQKYQVDLRAALAPLSKNTTPEISLFSAYVQSKDSHYLDELRLAAQAYADAVSATAQVAVPQDAAAQHIGILNAMGEFANTLKALADNADDPITVIALLQTYNDSESSMVVSFNTFASYIANHQKS